MTLRVGTQHFCLILRIRLVVSLVVGSHLNHVQGVILHQIVVIEDTLGPAGAEHGLVNGHILHGLLVGIGQAEIGLLGAHFRHIIMTIGMLAAVMYILLMNALRVPAVDADS